MKVILNVVWNALLSAAVITLLAGLFVAAMPPVYRATAVVEGDASDMLMLRSAQLLEQVVSTTQADLTQLPGWMEQLTNETVDPLNLVRRKVFVAKGAEPGWIDVTVEASHAETASTLANEIARAYVAGKAVVRLNPEEKATLFKAVEAAEARLKAHTESFPMVLNFERESQRIDRQLTEAEQKVASLGSRQEALKAELAANQQSRMADLNDDGVLAALKQVEQAKVVLAELSTRYGERHMKMQSQEARVAAARKVLEERAQQYGEKLREQLSASETAVATAKREIRDYTDSLDELRQQHSTYRSLLLERESAFRKFEGMAEENTTEVFADAAPPGSSFGYSQLMLLMLVFVLSFLLMLVLVSLRALSSRL